MCLSLCIHKLKHVLGLFALYILRSGLQQQPFRLCQALCLQQEHHMIQEVHPTEELRHQDEIAMITSCAMTSH